MNTLRTLATLAGGIFLGGLAVKIGSKILGGSNDEKQGGKQ